MITRKNIDGVEVAYAITSSVDNTLSRYTVSANINNIIKRTVIICSPQEFEYKLEEWLFIEKMNMNLGR